MRSEHFDCCLYIYLRIPNCLSNYPPGKSQCDPPVTQARAAADNDVTRGAGSVRDRV